MGVGDDTKGRLPMTGFARPARISLKPPRCNALNTISETAASYSEYRAASNAIIFDLAARDGGQTDSDANSQLNTIFHQLRVHLLSIVAMGMGHWFSEQSVY